MNESTALTLTVTSSPAGALMGFDTSILAGQLAPSSMRMYAQDFAAADGEGDVCQSLCAAFVFEADVFALKQGVSGLFAFASESDIFQIVAHHHVGTVFF